MPKKHEFTNFNILNADGSGLNEKIQRIHAKANTAHMHALTHTNTNTHAHKIKTR